MDPSSNEADAALTRHAWQARVTRLARSGDGRSMSRRECAPAKIAARDEADRFCGRHWHEQRARNERQSGDRKQPAAGSGPGIRRRGVLLGRILVVHMGGAVGMNVDGTCMRPTTVVMR